MLPSVSDAPLARGSRVDTAYARLKSEILSNRLMPGFQGTEPEIAARLSMSRTPVREALIRLQSEGLVELIPRRGARVLPISGGDMREIYEILTALEPHAAAELAGRALDPGDLAPLDAATSDMEAALEVRDLDAWADADDRFHRRLLDLHGNARLTAIAAKLYDQAHRARMMTIKLRDLPYRSTEDHRTILSAIRAGAADEVWAVFEEHRRRAARELLDILNRLGLPQV